MSEIAQIISTVGFPIAICLVLLWYIKSMIETHKEESKEFTQAINNNTIALTKLCDKLEKGE